MSYSYQITSTALYSCTVDNTAHSKPFNSLFGALYMRNLDDKHPTWPGFDPSTSEFRATTGPNEQSGPERNRLLRNVCMQLNYWVIFINAMQCNAMQCNAMQCNAMQCNAMQCNDIYAMQCNAMQCNAMQCNAMQCNAMQCNAMQCNAMQWYICNAMQCNAMQRNAMQCNAMQWYICNAM